MPVSLRRSVARWHFATHRYWLVVGWLLIALVIWLSVTAQLRLHLPVKWADKVGHLTAYFVRRPGDLL